MKLNVASFSIAILMCILMTSWLRSDLRPWGPPHASRLYLNDQVGWTTEATRDACHANFAYRTGYEEIEGQHYDAYQGMVSMFRVETTAPYPDAVKGKYPNILVDPEISIGETLYNGGGHVFKKAMNYDLQFTPSRNYDDYSAFVDDFYRDCVKAAHLSSWAATVNLEMDVEYGMDDFGVNIVNTFFDTWYYQERVTECHDVFVID